MTPAGVENWPLHEDGVWLEILSAGGRTPERVLFLDRDGVLIVDHGYVHRPEQVELVPGAAALVAGANRAGIAVAVVTNQSGVDRGLFGWPRFQAVQTELRRRLGRLGAHLDAVAACPFHPDFTAGFGTKHAHWRKPGPGMILALRDRLGARLDRSWMVGDSARDIDAAAAAGLAGAILIGREKDMPGTPAAFATHAARDIDDARRLLAEAGFSPPERSR